MDWSMISATCAIFRMLAKPVQAGSTANCQYSLVFVFWWYTPCRKDELWIVTYIDFKQRPSDTSVQTINGLEALLRTLAKIIKSRR